MKRLFILFIAIVALAQFYPELFALAKNFAGEATTSFSSLTAYPDPPKMAQESGPDVQERVTEQFRMGGAEPSPMDLLKACILDAPSNKIVQKGKTFLIYYSSTAENHYVQYAVKSIQGNSVISKAYPLLPRYIESNTFEMKLVDFDETKHSFGIYRDPYNKTSILTLFERRPDGPHPIEALCYPTRVKQVDFTKYGFLEELWVRVTSPHGRAKPLQLLGIFNKKRDY